MPSIHVSDTMYNQLKQIAEQHGKQPHDVAISYLRYGINRNTIYLSKESRALNYIEQNAPISFRDTQRKFALRSSTLNRIIKDSPFRVIRKGKRKIIMPDIDDIL